MNLMQSLGKQSSPKIWLGGIRNRIIRAQSYYTLLNVLLLLITTYTVRYDSIHEYLPWFNFGWLVIIVLVGAATITIIDHKIIQPSEIAYLQHQAWKHRSPIRIELEQDKKELQERLDKMQEKLDELLRLANE